jgi:hypothetical protein
LSLILIVSIRNLWNSKAPPAGHKEKYHRLPAVDVLPIGFMFLQCKEGAEEGILERVRSIHGVAYAYKLESLYDIVLKIEADSVESFTSAISAIRKITDILNTDTMIGFK